jgi:hypothetical protein
MSEKRKKESEMWLNAKTLVDIGELTAKWITGKIRFYPNYFSESVDEETIPLRSKLAKLNRTGFITDFSQPGIPIDKDGFGQRASVSGYAEENLARQIATLTLHTELIVFIFPPDTDWGCQIPITIDGYRPSTWNGRSFGSQQFEHYQNVISSTALDELALSWVVIVIDPKWGRKSYLWSHLEKSLVRSQYPFDITPSDSDSLGTNLIY